MASANPFWFGYYPGDKPLVKRPPKIFPGPVLDFSQVAPEQLGVALDYYLDEVAAGVKNTMDLPKWLWDQTLDDWKGSFKASAMGYTPSGSSTYEFEGAEGADIPGVNVGINLYDLVTNPQKTLQKFIDKQVVAGIDPLRRGEFWTDLDTALTRRLYVKVAKGEEPLIQTLLSTSNTDPISFKNQKIYARGTGASSDDAGTGGPAATNKKEVEGEEDVYDKAGKSFADFVMNQKTTARRGRSYGNLQASFIKAAATELEQKKVTIHGAIWAIGPAAHLEADMAERFVDTFVDEANVIKALGNYNTRFTAPWGFSGSLSKKAFASMSWDTRYASSAAAAAVGDTKAEEAIKALESLKSSAEAIYKLDSITHVASGEVADVRKSIENARARLAAKALAPLSPEEGKRYTERLADFNRRVQPVEQLMEKAEKLAVRVAAAVDSKKGVSRLQLEALIREQTAIASQMSHQRYGGGVYNQYLMATSREYFEREDFGRNKYFNQIDPRTGLPVMSQGFRSLDPIYRYSKGQYLRQDGGDLIEAIIAGKYFERRFWYGKWRNYIQAFTPGYWTTKILKRAGYFGLVYDEDDELSIFLNPKDPVTGDDLHNFKHKLGRVLRPFTRYHHFNASFEVSYSGGKFRSGGRFEGGSYLSFLSKAWARTDPANQAKLAGVVDAYGNWTLVGTPLKQKQAFIHLLNGDTAGFETATGMKYQMAALGPDFSNAKKGALLFERKILKNRKLVRSLGLELDAAGKIIDNEKNRAILDGFFGKLGRMDRDPGGVISPFIAKVGLFNWMSAQLTKIQAFEAKLLAPFVKPFILLREGIKNLAGKLFRKALYAILGTATGGAGAFLVKTLGPFLERVFNASVARLLRYFTDGMSKAFKALLKGDINKAFEALAEEAAKMLAWAMACGCSIPILLILFVLLVITPMLSAVPPTSRSSFPASSGGSGTLLPAVDPSTTCLLTGRSLALGSINGVGSGHGSVWYWTHDMIRPRPSACVGPYQAGRTVFSIPFKMGVGAAGFMCPGYSCSPTDDAIAYCPGMAAKTSFYGFAADYIGSTNTVYAPGKMCGLTITGTWKVTGTVLINSPSTECGVLMETTAGGSLFQLFLIHLDNCAASSGRQLRPGDAITTLFTGAAGGAHTHSELMRNGVPVKPELCVCI